MCFFLMIRRPPRSTRTYTLFPYTTLFRSVSGRVVYTFRSRYYTADLSGQPQLRRFDPGITDEVTTLLEYVRPAGRLDFSVGYDVTDRLRRSEEHTSELQSLMRITYAAFCSKNKTTKYRPRNYRDVDIDRRINTVKLRTI